MPYTSLKLPRLPVNWDKQPQLFERYWDEAMTKLEKTLNDILQIPIIQAGLTSVKLSATQQSIATSFPVGLTMTVTSTGSLVISNHSRRYTDGHVDVAITGATIATGLTSGALRSVGYDDATRVGGTVTYILVIDDLDAHVSAANPARHYLGYFEVPAAAMTGPQPAAPASPPGRPGVNKFNENYDGGGALQ
jgi:hypothetical protein